MPHTLPKILLMPSLMFCIHDMTKEKINKYFPQPDFFFIGNMIYFLQNLMKTVCLHPLHPLLQHTYSGLNACTSRFMQRLAYLMCHQSKPAYKLF